MKEFGDKFWLAAPPPSPTYSKIVLRWKEDYSFATHLRRLLGLYCACVWIARLTKVLTSHGDMPRRSESDADFAVIWGQPGCFQITPDSAAPPVFVSRQIFNTGSGFVSSWWCVVLHLFMALFSYSLSSLRNSPEVSQPQSQATLSFNLFEYMHPLSRSSLGIPGQHFLS